MADGAPDVVLDGVSKVFGDGTVAVDDFSLSVRKGEFVALLGPSGCGKTTTLKMIGGFEEPTCGAIAIAGKSVLGVPPERRSTGMVFQNYALFPHMTVSENVGYGLKLRSVPKAERQARVQRMLSLMGLDDVADRGVDQLSGGQRQRVAVARSVVVEPDVLLLDEPLGALDANLRARMQSELKRLQRSLGITFVHVTGNQSEAIAMADRIAVVGHGRIAQEGIPHDVYRHPASRFVAQFMGNNNLIPATIVGVDAAGVASVESHLGEMTLPVTGAAPGHRGALCIRTDRVQFVFLGEPEPEHTVTGTIVGEDFAGSTHTYYVDIGAGAPMRVERHLSVRDLRDHPASGAVTLGWHSADVRFVTDDEADTMGGAA